MASGVIIEDLKPGTGPEATAGKRVTGNVEKKEKKNIVYKFTQNINEMSSFPIFFFFSQSTTLVACKRQTKYLTALSPVKDSNSIWVKMKSFVVGISVLLVCVSVVNGVLYVHHMQLMVPKEHHRKFRAMLHWSSMCQCAQLIELRVV